jgi:hypothetical protein
MVTLANDAQLDIREEQRNQDPDDSEPELRHKRVDRAALWQLMKRLVVVLTFPPVALGLGHTSLEDKVAAFMWALFLEVGYQLLQDYCNTFVSITSDMGTEVGICDLDSQAPHVAPAVRIWVADDG